MRLADKTPAAKRYARSYCRRCLAVMVCCVLVFGLTVRVQPKAEAAAVAVAVGSWVGDAVGSTVGLSSIAAFANFAMDFAQADIAGIAEQKIMARQYDIGNDLVIDIDAGVLGEAAQTWLNGVKILFQEKGGVNAGDSFEIPADVAEQIRLWTVQYITGTDGFSVYSDYYSVNGSDLFVFTEVDFSELVAYSGSSNKSFSCPVISYGNLVSPYFGDFSASYTYDLDVGNGVVFQTQYNLTNAEEGSYACKFGLFANLYYGKTSTTYYAAGYYGIYSGFETLETMTANLVTSASSGTCGVLFYVPSLKRIYAGTLYASSGTVSAGCKNYLTLTDPLSSINTLFTSSSTTDTPVTQPLTVTIPASVPETTVGEYTVPVITALTSDAVLNPSADVPGENIDDWDGLAAWLENWAANTVPDVIDGAVDEAVAKAISNTVPDLINTAVENSVPGAVEGALENTLPDAMTTAIEDALPVTGTVAGDQVVAEVAEDPDSLGAVFVSKFPFSIPWDIYKSIKLLAAPPVTPRFEVDFMEPIAYRVGGFPGDTTMVIDFGDYEIIGVVTRWVSTIMFVYALASATKKFIWTA